MFDIKKSILGAALFFAVSVGFCKSDSDDSAIESNLIRDCKELVKQICKKEDTSTGKLVGIRLAKEIPAMILLLLLVCKDNADQHGLIKYFEKDASKITFTFDQPDFTQCSEAFKGWYESAKDQIGGVTTEIQDQTLRENNFKDRVFTDWSQSDVGKLALKQEQNISTAAITFAFSIATILRLIIDFRKNKNFVQLEKWLKSLPLNSSLSEEDKKMIVKLIEKKLGSKISKNAGIMVGDVVYTIYVAAISAVFMDFAFGGHLKSKGKAAPFIADAVAAAVTVLCTSLLTLRQKGVYKEILKQLAVLKA